MEVVEYLGFYLSFYRFTGAQGRYLEISSDFKGLQVIYSGDPQSAFYIS